jgi:protein SCO1/2
VRRSTVTTAAAIALAALASGCGEEGAANGASEARAGNPASAETVAPESLVSSRFAGTLASPRRQAPPVALRDSFGRRVDLERFRGKAVIVTFLYVNCPDVCPLILDNLRAAQSELGAAADDMKVLAVSVDPENDTRRAVNRFLAAHRVTHRVRYLIGSRPELEAIWHEWGVVSKRSPKRNDPHFIEHSAMVYGISGQGEVTTLYPSSFDPAHIVHDVPILASQ